MPDKTYRVRIAKGDAEFEAEGDKTFVLEMLRRFQGLTGTTAGPERPTTKRRSLLDLPPSASARALSPVEFIRSTDLKLHTDIVLAFGYYLEKYKGLKDFTPADVNSLYYEVKMEPTNISMMCIQNIKRGRMMEPKATKKSTKKRYMLTGTGEHFIKSHLAQTASE